MTKSTGNKAKVLDRFKLAFDILNTKLNKMIKELQINNFKCFQQSDPFFFSKVNLLTGVNGRGKSSLLQTLLLLSQTTQKFSDLSRLIINGEFLSLGNFDKK